MECGFGCGANNSRWRKEKGKVKKRIKETKLKKIKSH
jgi:hypothetical protein